MNSIPSFGFFSLPDAFSLLSTNTPRTMRMVPITTPGLMASFNINRLSNIVKRGKVNIRGKTLDTDAYSNPRKYKYPPRRSLSNPPRERNRNAIKGIVRS